ncbi:hypothetical protein BGZ82_005384, partial [Podila clonocystis]
SRAVLVLADDRPYNWSVFTVPGNRICWNVIIQQSKQETDETLFRNSYWGPESCNKMIEDSRDLRTPYGTMGDLIDATPKDVISQVYLEDKLYGTWNHGRTILIGDGAVNALQDAAILANCIHDLDSASYDDIQKCFESFRAERYPHVKYQYDTSQFTAKFMYGHTKKEKLIRALIFGWLPTWMKKKGMVKDMEYQPQVNFLPLVEPRGSIVPLPQKPSKKGFIEGAVNALQDAVILAKCIHDLESTSSAIISGCFQDFKEQRHAHIKHQYETSQFTAKITYGYN